MVPSSVIPSTVVPTGVVVSIGVVGREVSARVMCETGIVMHVTRDMGRRVRVSHVPDVMPVTAGMAAVMPATMSAVTAAMSSPFGELGAAADNINAVTAANPSKCPFVMIMPPRWLGC